MMTSVKTYGRREGQNWTIGREHEKNERGGDAVEPAGSRDTHSRECSAENAFP